MNAMRILFPVLVFVSSLAAQTDSAVIAEHLPFGNPSGAQATISRPANYLMIKKQFVLSYHRFNGIPNWVAWHTDSTWLGAGGRSNTFRADSTLPAGWYRVHEKSYRKSGYDRGHLCPSGDRTKSMIDNSATFLMTNMIPQAPNNNQGPWAALELYCRNLVKERKELYLYCGGYGSLGFLDSGRVNIPEKVWKIVVILDAGEDDTKRVTTSTRIIAVVMPNSNALLRKSDDWERFRVTVDQIEEITGFDFFSTLPVKLQHTLESKADSM